MVSAPVTESESLGQRLRGRVRRLSSRLRSLSRTSSVGRASPTRRASSENAKKRNSVTLKTNPAEPPQLSRRDDTSHPGDSLSKGGSRIVSALQNDGPSNKDSVVGLDDGSGNVSKDIWSAAFREAVSSLGDDIDMAILQGKNLEQIFSQLKEMDKDAMQESLFLRGVAYLHTIQVPLEKFKWVLDLANPFAGIDPTAKIVFGVMTSVTTIAISFASADVEFAKQIGEMLDQLQYIDDCDTLGQRAEGKGIHKALVSVYRKILEFYTTAFDILKNKGVKRVLHVVLQNNRLPGIVEDLLKHAEMLHRAVSNVTTEVLQDIQTMLYDQAIAGWLGGDKIKQQSEYHATLQGLRADQACEFLLEHPTFVRWYDTSKASQLVVVGDVGAGKSVTAAFLVDVLIKRRTSLMPRPMVSYHYCRDDESGRIINILSVLVLSLLSQLPGLKRTFYDWYNNNQANGDVEPAKNPKQLTKFLEGILTSLDRPLFVVIDGLDECDRQSRTDIIELLKSSSHVNPSLKFLLFSRRNKEVLTGFSDDAWIDLISSAERDYAIARHIVDMQLKHLPSTVKDLIVAHVSRSAKGSAIWTKMVVKLIEDRQIEAFHPMQRFLKELPLPSQLSKLYDDLLLRCTSNDTDNKRLARAALKVLATSTRPLRVAELSWAVALATASPDVTTISALSELVDEQRVLGMIGPFISLHESDEPGESRLRLVHQSVKEYITQLVASAGSGSDEEAIRRAGQELEGYMLSICVRYLLLEDINQLELFSAEQMAVEELPQEADIFGEIQDTRAYDRQSSWDEWEKSMIRYDPTKRGFGGFFVYASSSWVVHFGAVDIVNLPSLPDIELLCAAGSSRLHNWTQQNCRPGCVVKSRFEFDSTLYDPLGITSLYGSDAMLLEMVKHSKFNTKVFLKDTATAAVEQVFLWGDLSKLKILALSDEIGLLMTSIVFWRLVLKYWSVHKGRHSNWDEVFALVDHMSDTLILENSANEIFCLAAGKGCFPLLQQLIAQADQKHSLKQGLFFGLAREQRPLTRGELRHQSVGEAVLRNHVDVVEFLLRQEGVDQHLNFVNAQGENVLHLASMHCNPAMYRLLLPHMGAKISDPDILGDCALVRVVLSPASLQDRLESARMLLVKDGSQSRLETNEQGALRAAVEVGDLEMCSLLINLSTADPLLAVTRSYDGKYSLKWETAENAENRAAICEFLTEHTKK